MDYWKDWVRKYIDVKDKRGSLTRNFNCAVKEGYKKMYMGGIKRGKYQIDYILVSWKYKSQLITIDIGNAIN